MIADGASRLTAEALDAGRGVWRLMRFDPRWADAFDLSADGFLRSFIAPILSLPFYLITTAVWTRVVSESGAGDSTAPLWAGGVAHLVSGIGFPALLAVLARPAGLGEGYAAFVIVSNWAGLAFDIALSAAALPVLLTGGGGQAFALLALLLFPIQIFFLWRAGRETLSLEIAPVLMVVVLAVGVGAVSDQLGVWLASYSTPVR